MAKASEQMEKALKVSECVPEIGTELHRERLLSKLLDEAVVDGDPQSILLFKGLVRAAGEEDDGEAGTLGECARRGARRHQGAPGCPHLQRPPQGHQLQKAARYRAGPTES